MNKKSLFLIFSIMFFSLGAILLGTIYTNKKFNETFIQAEEKFNNEEYLEAYSIISTFSKSNNKSDELYKKIMDEFNNYYKEAISLIKDGSYVEAKEKLKKIPLDYKNTDLLINNLDVLKKLVENNWYTVDAGWYYNASFYFSDVENELELFISEDEFDQSDYINTYVDRIDLIDLLDDGKVVVKSYCRDNFTLNINELLSSDKYILSNSFIHNTYRLRVHDDPKHIRPNCQIKGCDKKANTFLIGLYNNKEYYCSEHYESITNKVGDILMGI